MPRPTVPGAPGKLNAPYGQQQYGQPYAGQYGVPQATNGFAVAALVLGIIGGSVLAIVFGHISLHQINTRGGKGKGMAIAGQILGYVWLVALIGFRLYLNSLF